MVFIFLNTGLVKRGEAETIEDKPMENNDNKSSFAEVQARIFQIISTMPEAQKRKLLTGLEKWQSKFNEKQQSEPKHKDKRKYYRQPVSVYAICATNNGNFRDFTKDVSAGGAFIQTKTTLSYHEDIFLTLLHNSFVHPVRTNGKVVRVDPEGVGVHFDQVIPSMFSV